MDTLSYKTKPVVLTSSNRSWYVVDAQDKEVGRICSHIAHILRGKHKPSFTPYMDAGDYVIVINADKVRFTGKKLLQKEYITYSLYPGGQKRRTAAQMLVKKPIGVVENAVKGMLPKNTLGKMMFRKLFVYAGTEHPHSAQKPQPITFKLK